MRLSCLWACLLLAGAGVAAADELEDAFENLKKAEADKDVAQVKKLAAETHALALKELSAPAPTNSEEKDNWTKHIAYVKEIDVHTEYSLYAVGSQSPAPVLIDLISTLEQQNPKSKYLDLAYGPYLAAIAQAPSGPKPTAVAAKAIGNFPENESLLSVLMNAAYAGKQLDSAANYATRLTNALSKHGKPEGVAAADWERYRSAQLGRGYWVAGVIHADQQKWVAANKELRAALPYIKGDDSMAGPALFSLGLANYQLGKLTLSKAQVTEAASFFEQAAKYPAFATQAWRNAAVAKKDAAGLR